MLRNIIYVGIAYIFIYLCVYTSHNYMIAIIRPASGLSLKQVAILDVLLIIKFFGAFFWTNIADRTNKHNVIISIGLLGYSGFLCLFKFAPSGFKPEGINPWTVIYKSLSLFFLSAVFSTVDAMALLYLESINKVNKWYGRIRIFSTFGHILAHLCVYCAKKLSTDKEYVTACISLTLVFGILGAIFILVACDRICQEKRKLKNITFSLKLNTKIKYLKEIATVSLLLVLLAATTQGIPRQSLTTFFPELIKKDKGNKEDSLPWIFIIRSIPEIFMLYVTPYVENYIGIYWMWFIGILFGLIRPFSYSFLDISNYSKKKQLWVSLLIETPKGVFSSLFGYSGSKIMKELFTAKRRSVGQGFFNGCYSGLAPCLSGLFGYFLLSNSNADEKNVSIRSFFFFTACIGAVGLIPAFIFISKRYKEISKQKQIYNHCNNEISIEN